MNFRYGKAETDYLKSRDKRLGEIIERVGPIERGVQPDLFRAIVRNIVAQQISGKAAATIMDRMESALGEIAPWTLVQAGAAAIQRCGTSLRKAEYIADFAAKVASGEFDIAALERATDAEVVAALSSLRGIGVWTAEMLLLFTFRRPDVLSFGDLGIHRGMRMVYRKRKIDKALFERIRRRLSPCGSVASLYFWAVAGGAIPDLTDPAAKRNNPRAKGEAK